MRRFLVQVRLLVARLLMGYFRLTVIQVLLLEGILLTLYSNVLRERERIRCGLGKLQWRFCFVLGPWELSSTRHDGWKYASGMGSFP